MKRNSKKQPERLIEYRKGWLRVGRQWFGIRAGRPVVLPVVQGGTSANTTQEDFWFRNDDGSLTTATYIGSQNQDYNPTLTSDLVFRIRIIAEENNGKTDPWAFQLAAQKNGSGGYSLITTTRTDGIQYSDDGNGIADGSVIAVADFDLTWSGTGTDGEYDDAQSAAGTGTIGLNGTYVELEFCLKAVFSVLNNGDFFDFQLQDTGGGALDGYTRTPRLTITKQVTVNGAAVLNAGASLAALAEAFYAALASLASSATLTAAPGLRTGAQATIAAGATLSASAAVIKGAQATLAGSAAVVANGELLGWSFPFYWGAEDQTWDTWDGTSGTAPTISVAAALVGSYGVELPFATDGYGYLTWTNTTQQLYRFKFRIDPNNLTGDGGDRIQVCKFFDGVQQAGYLEIFYSAGDISWAWRVVMRNDAGGIDTGGSNLFNSEIEIEAEWTWEDTTGHVNVWEDGSPANGLSGVDSGTYFPDQLQFGHVTSAPDPNSGVAYLDEFNLYDTVRPSTVNGAATLNGAASMSAAAGLVFAGQTAASGSATVTAVAEEVLAAQAQLNGSATLSAVGQIQGQVQGSATLAASASLTGAGGVQFAGQAVLNGSADVIPQAGVQFAAQAVLAGSADVIAAGATTYGGVVSMPGSAALTSTPSVQLGGSASLSGSAQVISAGAVTYAAAAVLDGSATLTAVGTIEGVIIARAALNASASMSAAAAMTYGAAAALNGQAIVSPSPAVTYVGTALLDGSADLSAIGQIEGAPITGAAVLAGSSSLSGAPGIILVSSTTVNGSATMVAIAQRLIGGRATIAGTALLDASAQAQFAAAALLQGSATLTAVSGFQGAIYETIGGVVYITRELKAVVNITTDIEEETNL
jgi:hypothetical protein